MRSIQAVLVGNQTAQNSNQNWFHNGQTTLSIFYRSIPKEGHLKQWEIRTETIQISQPTPKRPVGRPRKVKVKAIKVK